MYNEALRSREGRFQYSGAQKYIRIIQRQPRETVVDQCLILDEGLSVISRQQGTVIELDKKANKEEYKQDKIQYTIPAEKITYFYEKTYAQYPLLNDFIIGRANWGRNPMTIRLNSDSISRQHTKIECHNKMSKKQYADNLKEIIRSTTRISSKWRKLTSQLIENITEYLLKPYYTVQDRKSRNGTYIQDRSKPIKQLQQKDIYQFEQINCSLIVMGISLVSGQQLAMKIEKQMQYKKNLFSDNLEDPKIIWSERINKDKIEQQKQLQILEIQINVDCLNSFNYWVVNKGQKCTYPIGFNHLINISSERDIYESKLLANIVSVAQKWKLVPSFPEQQIWVKLLPERQYVLSENHYKLMIARYAQLEISFHNF